MYELAMEYLAEGVPVEGLGCQGHTKEYVKPDPTNMWVSNIWQQPTAILYIPQ
jgi:GH35 family endo-1,4-beta-xylanase